MDSAIMELICVRSPSKKDGKLRVYWKTGFSCTVKQQGDEHKVEGLESFRVSHRAMKRLTPVLVMFQEWLESEPVFEGTMASVLIAPEDMQEDGGRGLSRILQYLKDSYRRLDKYRYPRSGGDLNAQRKG